VNKTRSNGHIPMCDPPDFRVVFAERLAATRRGVLEPLSLIPLIHRSLPVLMPMQQSLGDAVGIHITRVHPSFPMVEAEDKCVLMLQLLIPLPSPLPLRFPAQYDVGAKVVQLNH